MSYLFMNSRGTRHSQSAFSVRLFRNAIAPILCNFSRCDVRLVFFFSLFTFHLSLAQSPTLDYAHYIIDTLTSPYMDGRGYVDSGEFKAATFIRNEFSKDSLLQFRNSYFQPMFLDVNIFPGEMKLTIGNKALTPGKDFLVNPSSQSVDGVFQLYKLEKNNDTSAASIEKLLEPLIERKHNKKWSQTFIAIQRDQFTKEQYNFFKQTVDVSACFGSAGCIEFTNEKLTWDASTDTRSYCYLQVTGKLPKEKNSLVSIDIESEFKKNYSTQNVLGFYRGISVPDSFIVFTAHYDHLGQMGDGTYFPGANDNASGTSMVLNLVKYFSQHPSKYSVAFICFTGEELGLLGSTYFVQHPQFPIDKIKFLVNLDIVGTGDEGIKVVNATEFPKQFDQLVKLNDEHQYLRTVSPRGKAANSDHYPFYVNGVPCFFIYTMGGIAAYHDVNDRSETLPLTDYEDLFKLLIDFEKSLE